MARQILTHESSTLSRKERKALQSVYAGMQQTEVTGEDIEVEPIPSIAPMLRPGFWSFPLTRPPHRATGYKLAAANPMSAAHIHEAAGPIIGLERQSGGAAFTFDPWELYARGLVASPNLLIEGSLRQGKSFVIKRLITLLAMLGRCAINVSDSKGEHGVVAEAIGGPALPVALDGRVTVLAILQEQHIEACRLDDVVVVAAHRLTVPA